MPIRLKAIHIVFQPAIFNVVWHIFKPFIKEKLNKRVRTGKFNAHAFFIYLNLIRSIFFSDIFPR